MLKGPLFVALVAAAIAGLHSGVALASPDASSISIASSKPVCALDETITLTGTLVDTATPAADAGRTLAILRSTNQDATADRTRYAARVSLPSAGRWRIRAFHIDWSHVPTYSAAHYMTVTAPPFVVVIDPGHQGQADNRPEPIGPGSSITKPAVADGAEGVVTHRRESLDNLEVSLRLRDVLQSKGVRVIMVRTSENVDIPNSERAKIANRVHANLLIHLHCDGVNDRSVHGLLTLVPGSNQWTGPIVTPSARA